MKGRRRDAAAASVTRIAECVRFLDGGKEYGAIFLAAAYPHESRFLAEEMRLTHERIDSALDFLRTVREGIDSACPTCGCSRHGAGS